MSTIPSFYSGPTGSESDKQLADPRGARTARGLIYIEIREDSYI